MKLGLLFILLLLNSISYAQSTINNFFSTTATNYAIVTSSATIDQSATGENLVWNFNSLEKTGKHYRHSFKPNYRRAYQLLRDHIRNNDN